MRINFKVEGRAGLVANFAGARRDIEREIVKAVKRYTNDTHGTAQGLARVDSGKMRSTIEKRITDRGRVGQVGWDESDFTSDGDYPYFYVHELGSSQIPAQPMIGPAHRIHAPVMLASIGQQMRKIAKSRSAR